MKKNQKRKVNFSFSEKSKSENFKIQKEYTLVVKELFFKKGLWVLALLSLVLLSIIMFLFIYINFLSK